ncbi:serine hydrolase domain-containing protein [Gryllotalpicola reticulitermitis]|uniref:Serine hydrolase domain-containing protein n=1 Tax=Gryllotalpicola reticulitermitis TaxID=1184153 RepID=A0ABV8Q3I9_9MICO
MTLTQDSTAPGYEAVAELFAATADAAGEYDAQLVVYVRGERVVDLASGIGADAMMTVFSASKGLAAIALALLVDQGRLDLDATVAHYWPEFGAAGKQAVTVRQLLSHQAGLPGTDEAIPTDAWLDHHRAADLLARQRPLWRPGAGFGYHAMTLGSLMSELCFRVTGMPLQEFYEQEVRRPASADAFLGLPDELEDRVVELLPMADPTAEQLAEFGPLFTAPRGPYLAQAFAFDPAVAPSKQGRAFGQPASGGVASARGLAAVYQWAAGFGDAASGITSETLAEFAQPQVLGYDLVLDQPYRSHGVVFQKPVPAVPFGSYRAFGHDGAGGAMAFADPARQTVLAYTVRRAPFPGGMDRRVLEFAAAVERAVDGAGPTS